MEKTGYREALDLKHSHLCLDCEMAAAELTVSRETLSPAHDAHAKIL